MIVKEFSLEEWGKIAEAAHLLCFNEIRPKEWNTFDYAIAIEHEGKLTSYATIIEADKFSCYMQHGGAFPNIEGTSLVKRHYDAMIKHLASRYEQISTRIENTNVAMLKLALSAGLLIIGNEAIFGKVYLHLHRDNTKE